MAADPAAAADRATATLRRLLRAYFAHTPVDVLATALVYELTSTIAAASATETDAIALLTAWLETGVQQIRAFGVGRLHP